MCWETYEPAPAGALNSSSIGVELLREYLIRTPAFYDGLPERAVLECTAVAPAFSSRGSEVLPEERVVDVACKRANMRYQIFR
jgi:hypothetical protein